MLNLDQVMELGEKWAMGHESVADIGLALDTLEAALKVVEAVKDYDKECSNPAPDPIYKKTLRNRLFGLLRPFTAPSGK